MIGTILKHETKVENYNTTLGTFKNIKQRLSTNCLIKPKCFIKERVVYCTSKT